MSGKVIELKGLKEIEKAIKGSKSGKVIVEFYSPMCGHCTYIKNFYEELAHDNPKTKFYAVDILTNNAASSKYEIGAIPTFKYYNGDLVKEIVGGDESGLEKWM